MTYLLSNEELSTHAVLAQMANLIIKNGHLLATAESCTGGLIAATCTDLSGSSAWFDRGFVTYSNAAKTEMLGVDPVLIQTHGAVSEAVARAMVVGTLAHSAAQVAIAVTGIAGPTGGSLEKPVGTVWFGLAVPGQVITERCVFTGDRAAVRAATVQHGLQRLLQLLNETAPSQLASLGL